MFSHRENEGLPTFVFGHHEGCCLFHTQFLVRYWGNLSGTTSDLSLFSHAPTFSFLVAPFHTCRGNPGIARKRDSPADGGNSKCMDLSRHKTQTKKEDGARLAIHGRRVILRNMASEELFCGSVLEM